MKSLYNIFNAVPTFLRKTEHIKYNVTLDWQINQPIENQKETIDACTKNEWEAAYFLYEIFSSSLIY